MKTSLQLEEKPNCKQVFLGLGLFSFFGLIALSFLPVPFFSPMGCIYFTFPGRALGCEAFGVFYSLSTLNYRLSPIHPADRM